MAHPYERVSSRARRVVFLALLALTVVLLLALGRLYEPLSNGVATRGILSLELASTPERMSQVLRSWSQSSITGLAFSLGLNFLCLAALTNALALACVMGSATVGKPARWGALLAWCQWLAAAVWAIQNSLLARDALTLQPEFTTMSAWLAVVKLACVAAGLLYAVIACVIGLVRHRRAQELPSPMS